MIAELLICGAALGAGQSASGYMDPVPADPRWTEADTRMMLACCAKPDDVAICYGLVMLEVRKRPMPIPPVVDRGDTVNTDYYNRIWPGRCGMAVSPSGTVVCSNPVVPVGVVDKETDGDVVKCDCPDKRHLWHGSKVKTKRIQLACPAGHLTTRAVKGEQK